MEQKTINVYKYDELSDDAKDKALSEYNDNSDYYFLSDSLNYDLDYFLEKNKIKALSDKKLYFSLSYCQGDGVCFVGNFDYKGISFNVEHNGHYYHKRSVSIEAEREDLDDDLSEMSRDLVLDEIQEEFIELYESICDKIEKIGYSQIEYEQSEENFKEMCDANEYTFRENGIMENL